MRHLLLGVIASAALPAGILSAQDVLYYKFDAAGGRAVINYASQSALAPREGSIVTNWTTAWAAGYLGAGALRASDPGASAPVYTFVESGGHSGLTSSFTVAWFLEQRNAFSGVNYFFGSNGSGSLFRGYTGGRGAGNHLRVRNWGGTPSDLISLMDIQTPAQSAWVHVALVIDDVNGTATFYLDGVPDPPILIATGALVSAVTTFRVNAYTSTAGASAYDMDEFRLLDRAATAQEILAWSRQTSAADAVFDDSCGVDLTSVNGPPTIGNRGYAINLVGPPGGVYLLAIGANRLNWSVLPLPLDLGAIFVNLSGCRWHSSADVITGGNLSSSGTAQGILRIPAGPLAVIDGAALYLQAIAITGNQASASNPLAMSLGH